MNYKKVSYEGDFKIISVVNEYASETVVFIDTKEGYIEYARVTPCDHAKGLSLIKDETYFKKVLTTL